MINIPEIIYNSFKQREAKVPNGQINFAPSYLSDCRRKIYYSKIGETPSNPVELPSLLKMEWGNILHDDIQQRIKGNGILESFEEWREAEYQGLKFIYRYDGILNVEGKRIVLEIKTVYASGYKSIESAPKTEHILQAISYMVFEKIDAAIILYAGRDNGYIKQHTVEMVTVEDSEGLPTQAINVNGMDTDFMTVWRGKVGNMRELKYKIEHKQLPDRDFSIAMKHDKGVITEDFQKDSVKYKSDWHCSYCGFKDLCWAKEFEEIKKHRFFINGEFK